MSEERASDNPQWALSKDPPSTSDEDMDSVIDEVPREEAAQFPQARMEPISEQKDAESTDGEMIDGD
jgi:hypothetical protein